MKKTSFEERKNRISLTLLFMGLMLVILVATAAVVGGVIALFVSRGLLGWKDAPGGFNYGVLMLFVVAGSFVVGALLSFFYSKIPLKPINKILNALNRLASGDYSARISFKGAFSRHPAVDELTHSFNALAGELEQTEILRSDFINNFSHEFKTPIVSIAGFAALLKRQNLSEEERAEYLDIIEKESLRLSQMATNVLNLTKVEHQTILSDVTAFNLSEQIRTSVLMLEGKWSKKNLDWSLDFDEFVIRANEEMLKQVWINLFDNAVKFSPDGGVVSVEIREKGNDLEIRVANPGEEIPPEKREKIFNKFYQGDESHHTEGNGVGLAVVKRIVDLHGGKVRAESENGFNVFTVTLPRR